jgi:hypothetical protein
MIDILSVARGFPIFDLTKVGVGKVAVVLEDSICDSRKLCLAVVAHELRNLLQTMLSLSLPMMQVTKKVAEAGSVGG